MASPAENWLYLIIKQAAVLLNRRLFLWSPVEPQGAGVVEML